MVLRRAVFYSQDWWRRTHHDVSRAAGWHKYFRLRGGLKAEVMSVSGQLVEQIGLVGVVVNKAGEPVALGIYRGAFRFPEVPAEEERDDDGA